LSREGLSAYKVSFAQGEDKNSLFTTGHTEAMETALCTLWWMKQFSKCPV